MSGAGTTIELGELVLPGLSAAEGQAVAAAVTYALRQMWAQDRRDGIGWAREIGAVTLDAEAGATPERIGQAIAQLVRQRAVASGAGA